ncbi:MAG: SDR family oxidoreductase [Bacilli bacterium]
MKNIIITGGANGIGKETALLFSKNNNVIIIDNDKEKLEKLKGVIGIDIYKCDISNEKEIYKTFLIIKKKYKKIDILINNASQQIESSLDNTKIKEWKHIIDINLTGTFIVIKQALNLMSNGATILNVISVHHNIPRKNKYHYDSSKAGVAMLTKEIAIELAEKGITVNAISFGAVDTNMNKDWTSNIEMINNVLEKVPLKILFKPEQIATFIELIINNFSRYTTGSIFTIDGGRSLL